MAQSIECIQSAEYDLWRTGCSIFTILFYYRIAPALPLEKWIHISGYLMFVAFVFHTIGLGMRWYVSGRAPWSNGYESMIYIGWTTVLAGLLFLRKAIGGLTATMALAATIMGVAGMSWLDPEITHWFLF